MNSKVNKHILELDKLLAKKLGVKAYLAQLSKEYKAKIQAEQNVQAKIRLAHEHNVRETNIKDDENERKTPKT